MLLARLVIASTTLIYTVPGLAQDFGAIDMTGMGVYAMEDAVMDAAKDKDNTISTSKHATELESQNTLTYSVSKSRRQANQSRFLPSMPNGLEPASIDLIDQFDKAMRPMGLRVNNVADALTIWWVTAWKAVNASEINDDAALYRAVKPQASAMLQAMPNLISASDTQKQDFAELLLIQALVTDAQLKKIAGNSLQRTELAKQINQGAKSLGLDLTTMDLTEKGFMPRRK